MVHEFNYGVYASIEEDTEEIFVLSPNPSADGHFFSSESFRETPLTVMDASGRIVHQEILYGNEVQLDFLAPGLYYMEFSHGNDTVVKRVIVG